jgi:hypothetical protein
LSEKPKLYLVPLAILVTNIFPVVLLEMVELPSLYEMLPLYVPAKKSLLAGSVFLLHWLSEKINKAADKIRLDVLINFFIFIFLGVVAYRLNKIVAVYLLMQTSISFCQLHYTIRFISCKITTSSALLTFYSTGRCRLFPASCKGLGVKHQYLVLKYFHFFSCPHSRSRQVLKFAFPF